MTYLAHYSSPLGAITLASDGEALTGLWFDGQKYDRAILRGEQCEEAELPVFKEARRWLELYFAGKNPGFRPKLRLMCSDFRKLVAEILLDIPFGDTQTYGEIAAEAEKRSGHKTSARAVGNAVGHNPISIIIPCHRVLGAGGQLTGYAGGMERKRYLLQKEQLQNE